MKTIASTALLIASAAAVPHRSTLADRVAKRAAAARLPHEPSPLERIPGRSGSPEANGSFQVDYSSNWAGAVLTSPPSGTTFNEVSASFVVPEPNPPNGASSGSYAASAWVGIDGDTYGNAILQSGCDFTADTSGGKSYDCWYEWFPNALTDFSGFTPSAGDTIAVSVVGNSASEGTATLTNQRTGQVVSQVFDAPSSTANLAGQNAEWIVEDFSSGGGLVPFANFGSVTFTACQAIASGQTLGTDGADILEITQNGNVVTTVTVPSSSEVQVTYQ